jgi:hypothetical protein
MIIPEQTQVKIDMNRQREEKRERKENLEEDAMPLPTQHKYFWYVPSLLVRAYSCCYSLR